MEVITNGRSRREMEQRLAALQTSLNTVETSITKFENLIEDCRMVEEELHQIEEDKAHQEEEKPPTSRWSMRKNTVIPSPLAPVWRPIPRTSLRWSPVEISSPQKRKQSSWMKRPNLRIRQPDLTAPGVRPPWSQEGWPSYVSHP